MTWTTTPPTEPGRYWHRADAKDQRPNIVEVDWQSGRLIVLEFGTELWGDLSEEGGEWWSEPIQPPPSGEERAVEFARGWRDMTLGVVLRPPSGESAAERESADLDALERQARMLRDNPPRRP